MAAAEGGCRDLRLVDLGVGAAISADEGDDATRHGGDPAVPQNWRKGAGVVEAGTVEHRPAAGQCTGYTRGARGAGGVEALARTADNHDLPAGPRAWGGHPVARR